MSIDDKVDTEAIGDKEKERLHHDISAKKFMRDAYLSMGSSIVGGILTAVGAGIGLEALGDYTIPQYMQQIPTWGRYTMETIAGIGAGVLACKAIVDAGLYVNTYFFNRAAAKLGIDRKTKK